MENSKRIFFKSLFVVLVLFLGFFLVACDPTENPTDSTDPTNPTDPTDPTDPTTPVPNMMGQEFVIMANRASTSDPRSSTYTGSWKQQKIAAIEAVEAKYNVQVVYKTYPA